MRRMQKDLHHIQRYGKTLSRSHWGKAFCVHLLPEAFLIEEESHEPHEKAPPEKQEEEARDQGKGKETMKQPQLDEREAQEGEERD